MLLGSSSRDTGWRSGGPHAIGRPSSPVGKSGAKAGTGRKLKARKALSRPRCCAKMAAESLIREVGPRWVTQEKGMEVFAGTEWRAGVPWGERMRKRREGRLFGLELAELHRRN
jgi:hypothetical protein